MMRIYKSIGAVLVGGLLSFPLHAQEEQTEFDLAAAEEYGVNNNLKVKNALLEYESARKKVWETTAIGLPQINLEGQFQHLLDIPTSVVDASLFNPLAPPGQVMEFQMGQEFTTSATLNVSQLIFDGSYIVALKFSKFYQSMATTSIELTKQETKTMVREAFYNVLVAEENVRLMDSVVVSTEKMWKQTKAYEEAGLIEKEEVQQLELAYNRIKASRQNAARQVEVAKNLLKLSMGYDMDKDIQLNATLEDVVAEIVQNNPAIADNNVKDNPNYVMLDQQVQLDEYSIKNEKAAFYPSLGAFFTHSQNAFRNEFDFFEDKPWYPTTVWGVSLKIPVTSSGMKIAKVQQAEIKMEKDQNSLEDLEKTLKFQEFQLKSSFQNAMELMEIEKSNVELATTIYNNQLKRKTTGVAGALQVTQLQNQLLTAEGNYIAAVMQLLSVKVELDKLFTK